MSKQNYSKVYNNNKLLNVISLLHWPKEAVSLNNITLSPKTTKIMKSVNIDASAILPITFQQFRLDFIPNQHLLADLGEMYEEDKIRREKKVEILKDIRKKCQKSKQKSKYKLNRFPSQNRKRTNSYNSYNPSFQQSSRKIYSKGKSPLIPDRHWKNSQYYQKTHYKLNKQKKQFHDDSTRSRRHTNQYQMSKNKNNKIIQSMQNHIQYDNNFRDNIIDQLNKLMQKWTMFEQLQSKQLENIFHGDLPTEKEKRRLTKIHKIEKQQIRYEIDKLKMKLNRWRGSDTSRL